MPNYLKVNEAFPLNVPQRVTFPYGRSRNDEATEGKYGPFYYVTVEILGEKYGWSMDAALYEFLVSMGLDKGFTFELCREKIGSGAQKWKVLQPDGQWVYVPKQQESTPQHSQNTQQSPTQPPVQQPPPQQNAAQSQQEQQGQQQIPIAPPQQQPPANAPESQRLPKILAAGETARQCLLCARTALTYTMNDMGFGSEDVRSLAISMMISLDKQGFHPSKEKVETFKSMVEHIVDEMAECLSDDGAPTSS